MTQLKKMTLSKDEWEELDPMLKGYKFLSTEHKTIEKFCLTIRDKYVDKLIKGNDGDMMDIERGVITAMDFILSLEKTLDNRQREYK